MGQKYLLDTNAILDFMGKKLPEESQVFLSEIIDDQINISSINKMELLGFFNVEQDLIDFVSFAEIVQGLGAGGAYTRLPRAT